MDHPHDGKRSVTSHTTTLLSLSLSPRLSAKCLPVAGPLDSQNPMANHLRFIFLESFGLYKTHINGEKGRVLFTKVSSQNPIDWPFIIHMKTSPL
jgi:hypothetical protein